MTAVKHEKPIERRFDLKSGTDPALTLAALWWGPGDLVMTLAPGQAARTMRLPSGAATVEMAWGPGWASARAWGPGAAEALELVPGLIGAAPRVRAEPAPRDLLGPPRPIPRPRR